MDIAGLIMYLGMCAASVGCIGLSGRDNAWRPTLRIGRKSLTVNVLAVVGFLIPVVFMSLKYIPTVSSDYQRYHDIFGRYADLSIGEFLTGTRSVDDFNIELTSWAISQVGVNIFQSIYAVFAIYILITVGCLAVALRRFGLNASEQALVFGAYLLLVFPIMSGMRFIAAMSLGILALSFLYNRPKKYLVWFGVTLLLAVFTHASSVFFLVPAFTVLADRMIRKKKFTRLNIMFYIGALALALVGGFLSLRYILPHIVFLSEYQNYFADRLVRVSGRGFYAVSLVFVAGLWAIIMARGGTKGNRFLIDKEKSRFLLIVSFLYVLCAIPTPYNTGRLGIYFTLFPIMLAAVSARRLMPARKMVWVWVSGYALVYFLIAFFWLNQADLFPVRFLWEIA
jgi:hypothetical protein